MTEHDRIRLERARNVDADATERKILNALAGLQSTDDPDPEFMRREAALLARLRAVRERKP
jgi:hypothetical protein